MWVWVVCVTRGEIIAKLEQIAADGGSIAELNACKELLRLPEFAVEGEGAADPFADLDAVDELAKRRRAA